MSRYDNDIVVLRRPDAALAESDNAQILCLANYRVSAGAGKGGEGNRVDKIGAIINPRWRDARVRVRAHFR